MIPRIFHQIWINKKNPELPEKFRIYRDSWLKFHPDWKYKLWNLDNLDFTPSRMDIINIAPNYAQIADILRYEILFRHGGVYMDTDFECLRNIDCILEGVRNFACSEDGCSITNAILGSEPNSCYMARCVNALPVRLGRTSPPDETGPGLLTRVLLGGGLASDFTLFPQEWFYPYNWNEPHRANEYFPQAYAVHHWAHSWGELNPNLAVRILRRTRRLLNFQTI
jgi:mannosyltransferase OCH1-like enzyme